jgi:hypothetical protein
MGSVWPSLVAVVAIDPAVVAVIVVGVLLDGAATGVELELSAATAATAAVVSVLRFINP